MIPFARLPFCQRSEMRSDVFSKAKRSQVMSQIRSRGNKDTELVLAKLFRLHEISGWRRHVQIVVRGHRQSSGTHGTPLQVRKFSVRPDFIFPRFKVAVFVDGCFWHGCPRHATQPKSNRAFWNHKLAWNKARDRRVNRTLRGQGWRVVRIWECSLRRRPEACLNRIRRVLTVRKAKSR